MKKRVSKWYNKELYGKNWKQTSKEVRSKKTCSDCGRTLPLKQLQADHIVELSKGGRNTKSNLKSRCISCHKKKTALSRPKQFPRGRSGQFKQPK